MWSNPNRGRKFGGEQRKIRRRGEIGRVAVEMTQISLHTPPGGGGYQRWQELANEYEKHVQNLPDPDDASNDPKPIDENLLQEQAENTAKDLAKGSLEANAEAIGGYMATTFLVAGMYHRPRQPQLQLLQP